MYSAMLKREGRDPQQGGGDFGSPAAFTPSKSQVDPAQEESSRRFEKLYHDVQGEFDIYRREKEQIDKLIQEELDKARADNSDYRVQLAKDRSHIEHVEGPFPPFLLPYLFIPFPHFSFSSFISLDFYAERLSIVQKNFDSQGDEIKEIRKKNSEYSALIVQHQRQLERTMQDYLSVKEDLDRQKIRSAHLESEKELWKSSEARIIKENGSLAKEISRRDELLLNLQSMQQELQQADIDAKIRLSAQVEKLEEETKSLKKKLEAETERYDSLSARKEIETEDYRKQIAKLVSQFPSYFTNKKKTKTQTRIHSHVQISLVASRPATFTRPGRTSSGRRSPLPISPRSTSHCLTSWLI